MGLRTIAEKDLKSILENKKSGFGWDIELINPSGISSNDVIEGGLIGFSNDISQAIDPDTGQMVSGRSASIAIRISTLIDLGMPRGISDTVTKPWIVKFNDINGNSFTFKVQQSNPDRALGIVTCYLELYNDN